MREEKHRLTLDNPAVYRITLPGALDACWTDWNGEMVIRVGVDETGSPITTLTGSLDQAALHGVLRRVYALGLPLISVQVIEGD